MNRYSILAMALAAALSFTACATLEEQAQSAEESSAPASSAAPQDYQAPPDPATPEGAVTLLMDGAKAWDLEAVESFLPPEVALDQSIPPALQGTLSQMLERMEYQVDQVTTEGDQAFVDLTVTAVDAQEAINDAVGSVVAYVAKQQISGKPIEDYGQLAQVIADSIDIDSLPTSTTQVTAYLIRDAGGQWKPDVSDDANLPLVNAVTGGSLDLANRIGELAKTYGFTLG